MLEKHIVLSSVFQVIAVVMDEFTDVDLLCDLMEASNKRHVPVYVLLDEKNIAYFTEMCTALDIQNSHLGVSTNGNSCKCVCVLLRLKRLIL